MERAAWAPTPLEGVQPGRFCNLVGPFSSFVARASGARPPISFFWTWGLWSRRRAATDNGARYASSKCPKYEDPKDCRPVG